MTLSQTHVSGSSPAPSPNRPSPSATWTAACAPTRAPSSTTSYIRACRPPTHAQVTAQACLRGPMPRTEQVGNSMMRLTLGSIWGGRHPPDRQTSRGWLPGRRGRADTIAMQGRSGQMTAEGCGRHGVRQEQEQCQGPASREAR